MIIFLRLVAKLRMLADDRREYNLDPAGSSRIRRVKDARLFDA